MPNAPRKRLENKDRLETEEAREAERRKEAELDQQAGVDEDRPRQRTPLTEGSGDPPRPRR